jgi:hypothetical protein
VIAREDNKSGAFLKIVNNFGAAGGFDKILQRMQDNKKPMQIDQLEAVIASIGKMSDCFYRKFALEYIPKLIKATITCVLKAKN